MTDIKNVPAILIVHSCAIVHSIELSSMSVSNSSAFLWRIILRILRNFLFIYVFVCLFIEISESQNSRVCKGALEFIKSNLLGSGRATLQQVTHRHVQKLWLLEAKTQGPEVVMVFLLILLICTDVHISCYYNILIANPLVVTKQQNMLKRRNLVPEPLWIIFLPLL